MIDQKDKFRVSNRLQETIIESSRIVRTIMNHGIDWFR